MPSTDTSFETRPVILAEDRPKYYSELVDMVSALARTKIRHVLTAAAALEVLTSESGKYHLVMSGPLTTAMYGNELARRVKEMDPTMPVIMLDDYKWSQKRGLHPDLHIELAMQLGYVDMFYGLPIGQSGNGQTHYGLIDDIRRLQQARLFPPEPKVGRLRGIVHTVGVRLQQI